MRNGRLQRLPLNLVTFASLAMLLASCAGRLNLEDLPAPLKVALPTTCEGILQPVDVPAFGPDDDAIAAYLAMEATALGAAGEVDLARECLVKQRLDYAGKGIAR